MRQVVHSILNGLVNKSSETFQSAGNMATIQELSKENPFLVFISFIIVELIILFVGKWLWNMVVIKLFKGVNEAVSIWQILGLSILIKLMTN